MWNFTAHSQNTRSLWIWCQQHFSVHWGQEHVYHPVASPLLFKIQVTEELSCCSLDIKMFLCSWDILRNDCVPLFLFLYYSHTGPVRPPWRRTWTLRKPSPRLREQMAAFHLAMRRGSKICRTFSVLYQNNYSMFLRRKVKVKMCPDLSPASYLSSINVVDEVQRFLEGLAHVKL